MKSSVLTIANAISAISFIASQLSAAYIIAAIMRLNRPQLQQLVNLFHKITPANAPNNEIAGPNSNNATNCNNNNFCSFI